MNWPIQPLRKIADIVGGGTPSKSRPEFWSGGIPWVSPKDMGLRELRDTQDHISAEAIEESATQIVPQGSVLIVVRSGILAHRFPVAIARRAVTLNQDLKALVPRDFIVADYLAYSVEWLSDSVLRRCVKRGATVHSVDIEKLKALEIPVAPLSEQRRIVEILDQADRLCRLRAEADAKAERILPALFIKMFGDPLRLLSHPSSRLLSEFDVETQNGFACGEKHVVDGIPHLRMNNISDSGRLDLSVVRTVPVEKDSRRYRLRVGDVLFMSTNSEDKIGKTCVFTPPDARNYLFSNHLIRIRCLGADLIPEYLATFLHLLWRYGFYPGIAKRWVNQATVSRQALGTVRVPELEREPQLRFAESVRRIDKHLKAAEGARKRVSGLFTQLLQRAFSGSLTASWREAHMKELLQEMEHQAKGLSGVAP